MRYRKFGQTDMLVSETGFGAWAIGGGARVGETAIGWGDADDSVSQKAIHAALDAGINFFDTADIYGLGHSETLLGRVIGHKKDIIIASKGGNVAREELFTTDYTKAYLVKACEDSLRRLRRDSIDYYQLHTARLASLQDGACVEAMELLQQQGKIRYWGLSLNTFDPLPEAEYLLEQKKGYGFQLVLNVINQRALPLLKKAATAGYGIIARMPLQFGLLTGKFDDGAFFPENDHRKNRLTKDVIEATLKNLAPIWEGCKKYHCSKTELAMSYILSYPEISVVIPGIRTAAQARENAKPVFTPDKDDRLFIEQAGQAGLAGLLELIQKKG